MIRHVTFQLLALIAIGAVVKVAFPDVSRYMKMRAM